MGGSSLHDVEGLAWCFQLRKQWYESGGGNTGEVQSRTFQGENPRSSLNWLCVAMILLDALF
jgi:hypothetical protein